MGLLVECPKCKNKNGLKKADCRCGTQLKKLGNKNYWIEYYNESGRRKRERIGPSKAAAEQRLRDVLKARTEDRHIHRDMGAKITLGCLLDWYMELPEVKSKASYNRDLLSVKNLKRLIGQDTKIRDINPGSLEGFQRTRLSEPSPNRKGSNITPATVNREISCLMAAFNRAVRYGKIETNPAKGIKKLPENNVRERVLSSDEFENLLTACEPHLRPIVLTAYYTAMRRSEILNLIWKEVDLKKGFIRITGARTKTKESRWVPLHPRVYSELKSLPRGLHIDRVFLRHGRPIDDIKNSFRSACERAGIKDFTFHDLRHCAINNLRQAGNDFFQIMAISGHKTMNVFKRYNVVSTDELKGISWHDVESISGR